MSKDERRHSRQRATARPAGPGAVRAERRAAAWFGLALAVVAAGCVFGMARLADSGATGRATHAGAPGALPTVRFTDITQAAGIDFVHENGAFGDKLLPETMGGGAAFFDFDNDGDQDLLLINSQRWSFDPRSSDAGPATMALYRNDGTGRFEDVTAGSGLDLSMYGMGVAIGDYDNDGLADVYITGVGGNRLLRNRGEGRFVDVTAAAGVGGESGDEAGGKSGGSSGVWSTSSGWFDYDNDGDLDLFVCNYLTWSREADRSHGFRLSDGTAAYGRPQDFAGAQPYLYRNDGNGRFTEVAAEAGLHALDARTGEALGKSLGVTFVDLDDDGWLDIVVANDTVPNFLYRNEGTGRFRELGAAAGIAYDAYGRVRGAMGVDAARIRDDGALGLAIGNFAGEATALYVSDGKRLAFTDEAPAAGLAAPTRDALTFGVAYVDVDLDGRVDLLAANGHLESDIQRVQPGQRYAQSPQLFWNTGHAPQPTFAPLPGTQVGEALVAPMVGRGVAYADIDGDGDLDVLITAIGQHPRLLRNDQRLENHWLRFKLVGTASNRDAIGAHVEVRLTDRTLRRQVMPTRSYLSQMELPVTFGLGAHDRVESVTVYWPNGAVQDLGRMVVDRAYIVEQSGTMRPAPPPAGRQSAPPKPSAAAHTILTTGVAFAHDPAGYGSCGSHLGMGHHDVAGVRDRAGVPAVPALPCDGPQCERLPRTPPAPFAPAPPSPAPERMQAGVVHFTLRSPDHEGSFAFAVNDRLPTSDYIESVFHPPPAA